MNKHKSWTAPALKPKPGHLSTEVQQQPSSLTALQGASLAFLTGAKSQGNRSEQNIDHTEPVKVDTNDFKHVSNATERSPSRGRHLNPVDIPSIGRQYRDASPAPNMLSRSPSMVATRLASASSSPARENGTMKSAASLQREASYTWTNTRSEGLQRNTSHVSYTGQSSSSEAQDKPKLAFDKTPRIPLPRADSAGPRLLTTTKHEQLSKDPAPATLLTSQTNPSSSNVEKNPIVKPPVPAPRRAGYRAPLKSNLTGPSQTTGQSREEIINRMADAMVASSLASSRPSSPSKAPKRHGFGLRSSSTSNMYRIPATAPAPDPRPMPKAVRPMKHTLRKDSSDNEEDNEITKRGRRHLVRKHPNQHSEGDRKRWRDKVTEMERRRYEGVFAANRGLLLKAIDPNASPSRQIDPTSLSNHVVNIVVRDIWDRSRLPGSVLERIYDMVSDGGHSLNREQFVVGLWLIDQNLKGRKLPVNVSESVWASVRHSQGIKIRSHAR